MDIDSIWHDDDDDTDTDTDLVNVSERYSFDDDDDDDDEEEEEGTMKKMVEEDENIDTSVPIELLNYLLSSDRADRLKHLRTLSSKNKRQSAHDSLSNTRRNIKGHHVRATPKRRRTKIKINKINQHKKTKKIIFLN
tara:strand:+ start:871 stop:1281 length:411 start_codon:yes stop_codon:yes gene_type:complete